MKVTGAGGGRGGKKEKEVWCLFLPFLPPPLFFFFFCSFPPIKNKIRHIAAGPEFLSKERWQKTETERWTQHQKAAARCEDRFVSTPTILHALLFLLFFFFPYKCDWRNLPTIIPGDKNKKKYEEQQLILDEAKVLPLLSQTGLTPPAVFIPEIRGSGDKLLIYYPCQSLSPSSGSWPRVCFQSKVVVCHIPCPLTCARPASHLKDPLPHLKGLVTTFCAGLISLSAGLISALR